MHFFAFVSCGSDDDPAPVPPVDPKFKSVSKENGKLTVAASDYTKATSTFTAVKIWDGKPTQNTPINFDFEQGVAETEIVVITGNYDKTISDIKIGTESTPTENKSIGDSIKIYRANQTVTFTICDAERSFTLFNSKGKYTFSGSTLDAESSTFSEVTIIAGDKVDGYADLTINAKYAGQIVSYKTKLKILGVKDGKVSNVTVENQSITPIDQDNEDWDYFPRFSTKSTFVVEYSSLTKSTKHVYINKDTREMDITPQVNGVHYSKYEVNTINKSAPVITHVSAPRRTGGGVGQGPDSIVVFNHMAMEITVAVEGMYSLRYDALWDEPIYEIQGFESPFLGGKFKEQADMTKSFGIENFVAPGDTGGTTSFQFFGYFVANNIEYKILARPRQIELILKQ